MSGGEKSRSTSQGAETNRRTLASMAPVHADTIKIALSLLRRTGAWMDFCEVSRLGPRRLDCTHCDTGLGVRVERDISRHPKVEPNDQTDSDANKLQLGDVQTSLDMLAVGCD